MKYIKQRKTDIEEMPIEWMSGWKVPKVKKWQKRCTCSDYFVKCERKVVESIERFIYKARRKKAIGERVFGFAKEGREMQGEMKMGYFEEYGGVGRDGCSIVEQRLLENA